MARQYIKITSSPQFRDGTRECTFRFKIPAMNGKKATWGGWQKTGTKKKGEARRIAEEYRLKLEEELNNWRQWEKISFADYAEKWHEERRGDIEESSWKKEQQHINQIKESDLGKIPIDEIEPEDIEAQKKANDEAGWSKDKQKRFIRKVKQITKEAAAVRMIKYDPAAAIKDIKVRATQRKAPSREEVATMQTMLENTTPMTGYTTALYIALATGLRRGEILGLEWQDIDFPNNKIFIRRQLTADMKFAPPKWDSYGEIPMTPSLGWWLEKWRGALIKKYRPSMNREDAIKATAQEPVCPNKKNGYIDPNNFGRWWQKYFVKAGWGTFDENKHYEGYKLHEIRHYVATELLGSGADLESVRAIMRHKSISTTEGYLHEIDDNMQDAMLKLAETQRKWQTGRYKKEVDERIEKIRIKRDARRTQRSSKINRGNPIDPS